MKVRHKYSNHIHKPVSDYMTLNAIPNLQTPETYPKTKATKINLIEIPATPGAELLFSNHPRPYPKDYTVNLGGRPIQAAARGWRMQYP
jgi:hypothetical protein